MGMDQEARRKRMNELVEELRVRVQEWIHVTDDDDKPSIMTGCVIAFESSQFDESGNQMYRTDYLSLPPTSVTQLAGLITLTGHEINHRMFGHCSEH
jgi:hypothetical protein